MKRIARIINEKAGTKEGFLILLVVLWLLNALLMNELATDYFVEGDLRQGLYAFMSFTVFGLLTVSIIRLTRHLVTIRLQGPNVKLNEDQNEAKLQRRLVNETNRALEETQPVKDFYTTQDTLRAENFFFLKVDGKIYKILFDSLLYAEANGNYTKIILENNTLQPTMTFSSLERLLPKEYFIRLHRSFIINKSKISHIEGNRVFIGKTEIPIGSNYRDGLLKELGV